MRRSHLELLYFEAREPLPSLVDLSTRYPEFLNSEPLAPEFILHQATDPDSCFLTSQTSLSLTLSVAESLSMCSSISHFDNIRALYKEVFLKRQLHTPLTTLEVQTEEESQWFYQEHTAQQTFGPLTAGQMDQRFRWGMIGEKSKVRKGNSGDFQPYSIFVKEYIENLVSEQIHSELRSQAASRRSRQVTSPEDFSKRRNLQQVSERRNREERVLSNIVRPNLASLAACMAERGQNEEEFLERCGRVRSSTLQIFPNAF
jgi:hypothetical protein